MDGVPALLAGLDTTAGKVTVLENICYNCRLQLITVKTQCNNADLIHLQMMFLILSNVVILLQPVMQATGGQTVQKHATVETETAAVTL